MKKIALMLTLFFLFRTIPVSAMSASSAIVLDAENGRVLYEHNAYEKRSMASTTKIMTAICALEYGNLEDVVTVSAKAAAVEGSSIWLNTGEKITLKSLVIGLLLSSGNDAATAIAEHISGSEEEFAKVMTQKAREIGVTDTQFKNPHGLDAEGHYTTAYDLATITSYALKNPIFAEIVKMQSATIEWEGHSWGRTLSNHNKLLKLYDGCDGVKTGYTKKTGRCLVSAATRDEQQLVVVTLNDPDDWNDHMTLLDRCFAEFPVTTLCCEQEHLITLPVTEGTEEYLPLTAEGELHARLCAEERNRIQLYYDVPTEVKAPVSLGETLGTVNWKLDGTALGTVNLVASENIAPVKKQNPLIESFFKISRKWLNLPVKKDIINILNVEEIPHETSKIFSRMWRGFSQKSGRIDFAGARFGEWCDNSHNGCGSG